MAQCGNIRQQTCCIPWHANSKTDSAPGGALSSCIIGPRVFYSAYPAARYLISVNLLSTIQSVSPSFFSRSLSGVTTRQ